MNGALQRSLKKAGGAEFLPEVSGPVLERFDAKHLAAAIESELERAATFGWPKISLHMDVVDAMRLAKFLKGAR
jgi:hypothetical protein